MKRIVSFLFLLSLVLTACNAPTTPASQPVEDTPTPAPYYPDTPSPPEINAPLVDAPAIVSIDFLNSLDGWALTETQVVRTNDGGITWYNVTPPNVTETGYTVEMFVLDNDHVWLQQPDYDNYPHSGFLYRTTDGGLTWIRTPVPFSNGRPQFLDVNNGWMLVGLGVAAGSNAVAVYQTTDGGSNWMQKYINDPANPDAVETLPFGGLKSGLAPVNMQTAYVYGVTYASGVIYLFRTNDGGVNWSEVTLPLPPGAENFELGIDPDQMKFVTPNDGFIVVRFTGDVYQAAVYVTHDGGATWTLTPTLIPEGGSAAFLSADEMVLYNGNQFYVTKDAARTWSIIPPDIKFDKYFAMMDFVNPNTGWVIAANPETDHLSLYKTNDGGVTWLSIIVR